jgi:hypothetical protein
MATFIRGLFDRTIRLRDGLVENLTSGLACQQSDERKHRLVVSIGMRPMTRVTADTALSRSPSSRRPVP